MCDSQGDISNFHIIQIQAEQVQMNFLWATQFINSTWLKLTLRGCCVVETVVDSKPKIEELNKIDL